MSVTVTTLNGEVTHSEATLVYPNENGQLEVYSGDTARRSDLVGVYAVNYWVSAAITQAPDKP